MVEVLEFAFQNPTHFLGCLIFLSGLREILMKSHPT